MLKYRLILGPIMIALLLGVLWLDEWLEASQNMLPGMMIWILIVIGIGAASRELAIMFRAKGVPTYHQTLGMAGMLGAGTVFIATQDRYLANVSDAMLIASAGVLSVLLGIRPQLWERSTKDVMLTISASTFAFVYLGLMPGTLLAIRAEHTAWVLAAALLTTKSCDIGAYFTGRAIGKHKLIPWLSPGKTWEGLVGGVILAALISLATLTPLAGLHWGYALLVGAVLAVVGQGGDLLASMMKRDAAVKDSGSSIPGFGGVLDVIDSPLLTGPVAYWLLAVA